MISIPNYCTMYSILMRGRVLIACVCVALLSVCVAPAAEAATASAGWAIAPLAAPTSFSEAKNTECVENHGGIHPLCDVYKFTVTNTGTTPTDGSPITLTASVPAGLTVERVALQMPIYEPAFHEFFYSTPEESFCSTTPVRCVFHGAEAGIHGEIIPSAIPPGKHLTMEVAVTVNHGTAPGPVKASVTVEGGGVASASSEVANEVNEPAPGFGFDDFRLRPAGIDGQLDRQAGDHPNELRTVLTLNNEFLPANENGNPAETFSPASPKDIVVDLPVGLVGSILAAPECRLSEMSGRGCPPDTVIGEIITRPQIEGSIDSKIWNLVPEKGYPAEFGYIDTIHGAHVLYSRVVATPAGYVLQTDSPDIPTIGLAQIEVTFFGDPVKRQEEFALEEEKTPTPLPEVPFFTNPTECSDVPLTATAYMDSWKNPGSFSPDGRPDVAAGNWGSAETTVPAMTGCDSLGLESQLVAQPTTHEADAPTGLDFELGVPQSEHMGALGTATLKRTVAVFPEGFTIDPSAGDGLAACSDAQIGWEESIVGPMKFNGAQPSCPEASKIGTLELETPLVPHKLEGELFLAAQNENPFHSTLATYIVVNDPVTGVLIKIAGKLEADPHTGRLTATFPENPSLPFSDLKLHFFGGPRASLATPEACGAFTTSTELEPWSAPASGPASTPFDSFVINEGCPGGFNPSFAAGSTNLQAGAYTPFVASFSRSDTDQELSGLTLTLPPGLSAKIAGVPECGEAEIHAIENGTGGCPAGSRVGTVTAGAGPGPDPLFVTGTAYFTGPYNGGSFGLAVVVPAVAGPFNFGTVVVRQSLRIDPHTAQVTDVSDPFPKIIDGIPLRMRRVDLTMDRPEFTFNPTSCAHQQLSGALSGTPLGAPTNLTGDVGYATESGASSSFTTPFQVTNCAALKFQPKFTASTSGKTSKANGASLKVKLTYPNTPQGTEANIAKVKVDLPKQLPSRLTTLQKACTAKQFEANPGGCPAASVVGHAKAITPILPVPLEGPAYFVSHGGEAFPSLIVVLQGYGVTVDLVGSTYISHAGITSSTFKTVPDVPVGTFELNLSEGKFSALAANGNLCAPTTTVTVKKKETIKVNGRKQTVTRKVKETKAGTLAMPTAFVAQNGAELHQSTVIAVTGCAKAKKVKKVNKTSKHRK